MKNIMLKLNTEKNCDEQNRKIQQSFDVTRKEYNKIFTARDRERFYF